MNEHSFRYMFRNNLIIIHIISKISVVGTSADKYANLVKIENETCSVKHQNIELIYLSHFVFP